MAGGALTAAGTLVVVALVVCAVALSATPGTSRRKRNTQEFLPMLETRAWFVSFIVMEGVNLAGREAIIFSGRRFFSEFLLTLILSFVVKTKLLFFFFSF